MEINDIRKASPELQKSIAELFDSGVTKVRFYYGHDEVWIEQTMKLPLRDGDSIKVPALVETAE